MALYDNETKKATVDMHIKGRFVQSGLNLQIIANRLVENDDFCKLLIRDNPDVLNDERELTERERAEVLKNHVSTIPIADKSEDIKNYVVVQIADIVPMEGRGLMYSIVFDVVCNVETWNLSNYIQRPYAIMNEIDYVLSNTKIKSWGPVQFIGATNVKMNERALGYTMLFSFAEIS